MFYNKLYKYLLLIKFQKNESNEMFRKFFYITTISQDVSFQIVQENN